MNLHDKLRMVSAPKKPQAAAPIFSSCYEKKIMRALREFPGAFNLNPHTVQLMEAEKLPETFDPRRILYLDTETTGLGGGAGTVAFEVGVGRLTDNGFEITQLVMRDYPEERFLLARLTEFLNECDVICTFNGRSFDLPLLKTRYIMNKLSPTPLEKPHIDLLHIARRVWKLRLGRCNLGRLEHVILGMPRHDDLPGSEAPQRYFDYLKTKNFALLEDVLRHNEQDVASMCVLLNRMAWLYEHPEAVPFGEDVFSMGVALENMNHPEEARRCYRLVRGGRLHAQSQLRLAGSYRRVGNREEAIRIWQDMVRRREGGITPYIELAKYYEHIARNIPIALDMTRRALALLSEPGLSRRQDPSVQILQKELQYRYDRLLRKAAAAKGM